MKKPKLYLYNSKKVFYILEILDSPVKKDLYLATINSELQIDIEEIIHTKREG